MLCSWTLAGPGTAPIIGDALRSVAPIVDACMVIWTGPREDTPDGAETWAANDACHAALDASDLPVYLDWHSWAWRDDYGAARNAALDFAAETGADWGVMCDTDERVLCPDPAALRAWLAALPASIAVVCVHSNDGSHTRERFFRMPSRYRFVGRTHEMYPCPEPEQVIAPPALLTWSELSKTHEQLRAKFLRDAAMLRADIAADPLNGAAYGYLGVSLQSLSCYARDEGNEEEMRRLLTEAIEAWRSQVKIDRGVVKDGEPYYAQDRIDGETAPRGRYPWHEGTAWACYRAAECYHALGEYDRAIDCAVAGLVLDAGIGELYWIAAMASLYAGRPEQARAWAESAKAHAMGSASEQRRRGFRVVRGLTTGPDEVLAAMSVGFVS